jgi:hypothetical protein
MTDPCGDIIIKALVNDSKKLAMLSGGVAMIYAGMSTNDIHEKLDEAGKMAEVVQLHINTLKGYL